MLRRRGLAPRVLPPVSLVLATWASDYVAALTATRYRGPATSRAAHEGLNRWVGLFAAACRRAVSDANAFEERLVRLEATWRAQLGRVRAGSATDLLLHALPGAPILTVQSAAAQLSVGKRNRAFEAPRLIRVFTDLERQLARPTGDTRATPPVRRVSRRS